MSAKGRMPIRCVFILHASMLIQVAIFSLPAVEEMRLPNGSSAVDVFSVQGNIVIISNTGIYSVDAGTGALMEIWECPEGEEVVWVRPLKGTDGYVVCKKIKGDVTTPFSVMPVPAAPKVELGVIRNNKAVGISSQPLKALPSSMWLLEDDHLGVIEEAVRDGSDIATNIYRFSDGTTVMSSDWLDADIFPLDIPKHIINDIIRRKSEDELEYVAYWSTNNIMIGVSAQLTYSYDFSEKSRQYEIRRGADGDFGIGKQVSLSSTFVFDGPDGYLAAGFQVIKYSHVHNGSVSVLFDPWSVTLLLLDKDNGGFYMMTGCP